MQDRSSKPLYDPKQLVHQMVVASTEVQEPSEKIGLVGKDPAAVSLGRRGGLQGGKARAAALSPEQRSTIARKAAESRWKRK